MRSLFLIAALGSVACQEPFGTGRHDLVGLRVAAIQATSGQEGVADLRVAAVVEGRPWSDEALQLEWFDASSLSIEEIGELGPEGGLASGPSPAIPDAAGRLLALVASDGVSTWRGSLQLPDADGFASPPSLGAITARSLDQSLEQQIGTELDLEARRAWVPGEATDNVQPGDWVRFESAVEDGVAIRWMSTAPGGTFLEVEDHSTDWVSASFVRDDEDLEDIEIEAEGPRTLLALGLDPTASGANAWIAREFFVGEVPPGLFTSSGRFLPTNTEIQADYVRGTLVADDAAPAGIRLDAVESATAEEDPGTTALGCTASVEGWFDPNWLLEQRCTRLQVVGATVIVEVRP